MQASNPGVLARTELVSIIRGRAPIITSNYPGGISDEDQIQPSSVDLTIGNHVYGMRRTSLPQRNQPISELLARAEYTFEMEDGKEGFLHSNYVYIVPLRESVKLPKGFSAKFSPKSSIGRIDVFVRVLADGVPLFDQLPDNYEGCLYLEISPLSFRTKISPGQSLVQMRLKVGDPRLNAAQVRLAQSEFGIFYDKEGKTIGPHELDTSEHGVYMHIDLDRDIVGLISRSSADPLSLNNFVRKTQTGEVGGHNWKQYWEQIPRPENGRLEIVPDSFYLLATKERARIPTHLSGDIMPYDAATGEFRSHYAGFFDPGFGGEHGTTGVLEVRGRELAHELSDNQPICLMVFEQLMSTAMYKGHYGDPRPSLSKFFSGRYEAWERLC